VPLPMAPQPAPPSASAAAMAAAAATAALSWGGSISPVDQQSPAYLSLYYASLSKHYAQYAAQMQRAAQGLSHPKGVGGMLPSADTPSAAPPAVPTPSQLMPNAASMHGALSPMAHPMPHAAHNPASHARPMSTEHHAPSGNGYGPTAHFLPLTHVELRRNAVPAHLPPGLAGHAPQRGSQQEPTHAGTHSMGSPLLAQWTSPSQEMASPYLIESHPISVSLPMGGMVKEPAGLQRRSGPAGHVRSDTLPLSGYMMPYAALKSAHPSQLPAAHPGSHAMHGTRAPGRSSAPMMASKPPSMPYSISDEDVFSLFANSVQEFDTANLDTMFPSQ